MSDCAPSTVAAIDVGSNSVRMLIARGAGRGYEVLEKRREMARLGRSGPGGRLHPEAVRLALATLDDFAASIARRGATTVAAYATEAVRKAEGGEAFIALARRRSGLPLRVISGEEEARLVHLAARAAAGDNVGRLLVVDAGGSSTELVLDGERGSTWVRSLPLGSLALTQNFLHGDPPAVEEIAALREHVQTTLAPLRARCQEQHFALMVGTSGTIRALADLSEGGKKRGGRRLLERRRLRELRMLLLERPLAARLLLPGIDARRADILPAGALLINGVMKAAGVEHLLVSDGGLRDGMVLDLLANG